MGCVKTSTGYYIWWVQRSMETLFIRNCKTKDLQPCPSCSVCGTELNGNMPLSSGCLPFSSLDSCTTWPADDSLTSKWFQFLLRELVLNFFGCMSTLIIWIQCSQKKKKWMSVQNFVFSSQKYWYTSILKWNLTCLRRLVKSQSNKGKEAPHLMPITALNSFSLQRLLRQLPKKQNSKPQQCLEELSGNQSTGLIFMNVSWQPII